MEDTSSIPANDPVHSGSNRRRRQFTILFTCVLIATILWLLRAFENEYTTQVDNPVSYINLPDQMISLNPLPQKISLKVKGMGYSILKHNWDFRKTPLIIDFEKVRSATIKKKKGHVEYLPMNLFYDEFSMQFDDLDVLSINPDTIVFKFALVTTKKIRIAPIFENKPEGWSIPESTLHLFPDSIEVKGPDILLDTIKEIRTEPIKINKAGMITSKSLILKEIDKQITFSSSKVSFVISKKNPN